MPLVFVRLEKFVRLLVGEEVEDQRSERRRGANLFVQYARVAGRGNGVRCLAEPCDTVEDVVAQWRCE